MLAWSPGDAKTGTRVQIRGIVTYYEPGLGLFVQDTTAGVFVYLTSKLNLKAGQCVDVTGFANRGRYSPIIDKPDVQAVNAAVEISPRPVSLGEIYQGDLDAQWVQLTAVVRVQKLIGNRLELQLASAPYRIDAWVLDPGEDKPPPFEGRAVTIRGVAGTQCGIQGQVTGFHLFVNNMADIALAATPVSTDPAPIVSIRDLKSASLRRKGVGQVRVRGTVLLCWEDRVFIQDSTGPLQIHPQAPVDPLAPGDIVEAIGFLGPILDAPLLEDARIQKVGAEGSPVATAVSPEELLRTNHSGQLIEVQTTFLQWASSPPNRPVLAVRVQDHYLAALLDLPVAQAALPVLEPGSHLRLTGVCATVDDPLHSTPGLVLLLRSPADVKVIDAPFSVHHLGLQVSIAAILLSSAALAAVFWYTHKQRRKTEHVLQLQASLQAEMRQGEQQLRRSMEERDRIGRDLHDDIIQSIYAVGLNLEDCRRVVRQSPEKAEERVASAINTLNQTLRNVRGFLAGLEPKVLNGREFRTALKSLALTSGDSPTFQIEVDPSAANSLNSVQATQLLHIAKEAMSNSLRHAQAASASVALYPVSAGVRLEVRDNGVGFDQETIPGMGHGLRNMNARAREIGAELQILSAPGQGCRILATVSQRKPE